MFEAGEEVTITCDVYIRYDYEETGAPVSDDTVFNNEAELDFNYPAGGPYIASGTNTDSEAVTGTFLTVAKSDDEADFGTESDNTILYTIAYSGSEYYTHDTIQFTDVLADGQIFCTGAGTGYDPSDADPNPVAVADCTQAPSIVPTTVTENTPNPGEITAVFDIASLGTDAAGSLTFEAVVNQTYVGIGGGADVVAGDSLGNSVEMTYNYTDDTGGGNDGSGSESSSTSTPSVEPAIDKTVCHPELTGDPETCEDADFTDTAVDLAVGDEVTFRAQFTGTTNIDMKDIVVTDWVPSGFNVTGVTENPGGTCVSSADGNFPGGDPNTETTGTAFGLDYIMWDLGDVVTGSVWCAEITMEVEDDPGNADEVLKANLWKMQGANVYDTPYSLRDGIDLNMRDPYLVLEKTATTVPSPLLPGSTVEYTTTIENTGGADAEDVLVYDVIPEGMRGTTPNITSIDIEGTPLVEDTDYKLDPAYDLGTGEWYVDLNDEAAPAVETTIPAGGVLTIVYEVVIDPAVGAGADLTNISTVSYNTQDDGSGRVTAGTADPADDNTDDETVSLSVISVVKSLDVSTPGPITVGETLTYNLEVTVPQGMYVYWPEIVDNFDRDGVTYQAGSATLTDISGTPGTPASFDASTDPEPIIDETGDDSTSLTWYFNNPIDNSGQITDYVFEISFDVVYDGLEDDSSWELIPPGADDEVSNNADVNWSNEDTATRSTNETADGGDVASGVDQPLLDLEKTIISSGPYYGGQNVSYQIEITNVGYATAYDLYFEDDLPSYLESALLMSVDLEGIPLIQGTDFSTDFSGDPVWIDFDGGTSETNLAVGETITFTYSANIVGDVGSGAKIENTADVDWSTMDGAPAGSRRYEDGTEEAGYTEDTDGEIIDIAKATIDKIIDNPTPAEATIGEVIDYRLRVTVPAETNLYNLVINDVISTNGMTPVAGSFSLSDISGDPETAAALSAAPSFDPNTPSPGGTLSLTFQSPIDNANPGAPTGDTDYVFDVSYQMLVTGLNDVGGWIWNPASLDNQTGNTATLNWYDGATDQSANDAETLDVLQPYLVLDKELDVSSGVGGDTVGVTITITNNGESTAYELDSGWDLEDFFSIGFDFVSLDSITHSSSPTPLSDPSDYTYLVDGHDFTIEWESANANLAPGESLTIEYTLEVITGVPAGANLSNSADVDYSNQDGVVADERVYDDSQPVEGTADEDIEYFQVDNPTITKTPTIANPTIGDIFDYQIEVSIPTNTLLDNSVLYDTIPDGLTVLSVSDGTIDPEAADGTTYVRWNLGDVNNPPDATVNWTIQVRVDDTYFEGTPLDGLPAGIDGDDRDFIANRGYVSWTAYSETPRVLSALGTVGIAEPNIAVAKNVSPNNQSPGGTVTYTVVLANNGISEAYDISWEDQMAAELFEAGNSPVPGTLAVTHSTLGLLMGGGVDYTENLGVNPITIVFDGGISLGSGENITVVYDAAVEAGVEDGQQLTNTATVSEYSTQAGVDPNERTSGPSEDGAVVRANTPALNTDKQIIGDDILQGGQTVTYRYIFRNVGQGTAYNLDVTDILPSVDFTIVPGTTQAVWPGGSSTADPSGSSPNYSWDLNSELLSSEILTLEFDVLIDPATASGSYDNTASVIGEDLLGNPIPTDPPNTLDVDDDDTDTVGLMVTNPEVEIEKRLAAGQDEDVQTGEAIQYEIEITNTGDTIIDVLPLRDDYDSTYLTYLNSNPASDDNVNDGTINWTDLTTTLGDLGVGSSFIITVNYVANNEVTAIENTASVSGATDENADLAPDDSDVENTIDITNPSVTIDKSLSPGQDPIVPLGGTVDYTVTITNDGDSTIDVLPLEDTYDNGFLAYQSSNPASDDNDDDGVINWTDLTVTEGDLAPGNSITVEMTFAVEATGSTVNTAETAGAIDVNADGAATVSDDDSSLTVTNPNLSLDKSLSPGQDPIVPVGGTVQYQVTITNIGDTVLEIIPVQETYDSAVLSFTGVEAGTPAPDDPADDGQLDWTDITDTLGDLGVGASLTLELNFTVVGPDEPALNTVRLENVVDENEDNPPVISDTDNGLTATDPQVTFEKTLSVGQDDYVQAGDLVSFTIRITNTGSTRVDELPLADTYDTDYLSYESATITPDDETDDGILDWTDLTGAGGLEPGSSLSVGVNFRALSSVIDTENSTEAAGASDENSDPLETVSSSATASITSPAVSVTKDLASGQVEVARLGEEVTYQIEATNSGDTILETVPLEDRFPNEYLEFVSATMAPDTDSESSLIWDDLTGAETLAVGDTLTLEVTFRTVATGYSIENRAVVSGAIDEYGDEAEPAEGVQDYFNVYSLDQITLEKTADPVSGTVMLPDEIINFTVSYQNGSEVVLPAAFISDTVNSGLEYLPGSLVVNGVPVTDDDDGDEGRFDQENSQWVVSLGDLNPNIGGTIEFQARIRGLEYSRRGVVNMAVMRCDLFENLESNQTIHYVDPFDIAKTAEDLNGGNVEPGDRIRWTITVTNVGISETTSVVVSDALPEGVTYVPGSISGRGADDSDARNLRWAIGEMAVEETVELTFETTINDDVANGVPIDNLATVTSDQTNPKSTDCQIIPSWEEGSELGIMEQLTKTGADAYWLLLAFAGICFLGIGLIGYVVIKQKHSKLKG